MGVQWTEEQQKVIDLRNRNILVSRRCRFRQDGSSGGNGSFPCSPIRNTHWMLTGFWW